VSADDRKWSLQQDAISFLTDVKARCGLSSQGPAPPLTEQLRSCISTAYDKQRSEWITRLPPVAVPEVSRRIDQHIALQRDLSEVGFLPTSAAIDGVYGSTTRAAITAWQKARRHPATGFLSDEEANVLSDQATAHRGRPLGGQQNPAHRMLTTKELQIGVI
jgi:peptidoglycan hydrolase-like protein with peptidoglycan-binding domain